MLKRRFAFSVVNLPLERELVCGPITLFPIKAGQEELEKQDGSDVESVLSAEGFIAIPEGVGSDDVWRFTDRLPINQIMLLLSLAERRYIEMVAPTIQRFKDGEWQVTGVHTHVPLLGNPSGVSWHYGHAHLQEFMNRCLPIVAESERGEKQGLRLAIQFYRTNFRDDFVELQYLKSWMALEILFSSYPGSRTIVDPSRFKFIRKAIGLLLVNCEKKGFIDEHERSLIVGKLGEINRHSARFQAMEFFDHVFQSYPIQTVTDEDIRMFVNIRNDITHRGIMTRKSEGDHQELLLEQHGRLMSLLERTFLAIMGQDANLMHFHWSMWRFAR